MKTAFIVQGFVVQKFRPGRIFIYCEILLLITMLLTGITGDTHN